MSEADAEAFIQLEVRDTVARLMPVFVGMFGAVDNPPDPAEVQALLAGVEQTLMAITYGDQAAIERFRERATQVADVLVSQGRSSLADTVRSLPDTLVELLGRG